jgi:hypothetical protein
MIKTAVSDSLTFLDQDSIIIFVCGAANNPEKPTARERFMQYAQKHLTHYHFFMAEKFFTDFNNHTKMDLLSIETKLTSFSDCVIIILESVGSFTELGAFANSEKIAKIILTVNKDEFKTSNSFVTLGPIAKLDKISKFKPCVFANFDRILTAVNEISNRLQKIERTNRKRIILKDHSAFNEATPKLRMLFLMDLITMFNPLSHTDLLKLLTHFYGNLPLDIHPEIGMLLALNMIVRINNFYLPVFSRTFLFYSYLGCDTTEIRTNVINHYHKYSAERIQALASKTGK